MTDLWLRGGLLVDGTGAPPFPGDVRLRGDTIVQITPAHRKMQPDAPAIDCTGMVVTPGFVDLHTHSDVSYLLDPLAPSKVLQGVTTEVVGNCGFSAYPVNSSRRSALEEFLRGLGTPRVPTPWTDFDGYATALAECRPVLNIAPLIGHGALRIDVVGTDDGDVSADLLVRLADGLRHSLDQGAFGMSTGLTYAPSRFAPAEEIITLARVLRDFDALYATHSRATQGFETFDEAIDVGRRTGARVQFSHVALNDPRMWGRASDVLDRFGRAVTAGVDIKYDVYPYAASASSLTQYLPGWLQESGETGLRDLLSEAVTFEQARRELAGGLFGTIPWDWDRVLVSLAGPGDEEIEGLSIAAAAELCGTDAESLCLRLCARHGNSAQVVLFYRTESDVAEFLAHPLAVIGSDGRAMDVSEPGRPHPRSFGAYARLFERYVGGGAVTLADAVHKSTKAAADRVGIRDRGRIAVGARADLAVLDLDAVRETATWTQPCQLAHGVRDVWINGERVVCGGALTGARPGRVLRRR